MPVLFALAGPPLAAFADGAILALSVFLASRGIDIPLSKR